MVSAFGAALVGWVHEHGGIAGFLTTDPGGPFTYVLRAALLPTQFDHGILGVFAGSTPFGRATQPPTSWINGSLWTLPYEVRCYLVIGLVAVLARRWGDRRTITGAWLLVAAVAAAYHWRPDPTTRCSARTPTTDSSCCSSSSCRAPSPPRSPSGSASSDRGRRWRSWWRCWRGPGRCSSPSTCRSPPWCCCCRPSARSSVRSRGLLRGVDLSYGAYLYAWPSQQVVAMYGWAGSPWTFVAMSLVPTMALACASWFWVEAPLLRRFRPGVGVGHGTTRGVGAGGAVGAT